MKLFRLILVSLALTALLPLALAVETHDLRTAGTGTAGTATASALPATAQGGFYTLTKTVDFSEDTYGAGDTVQLFNIPIGTTVVGVSTKILTAGTPTTSTLDIGDAADTDGYLDGTAILTANTLTSSFQAGNTRAISSVFLYDENCTASQSAAAWGIQAGADIGGGIQGVAMPFSGHVVGISAYSNAAIVTGTLTADATIGGTVTGLQAVLSSASGHTPSHYASQIMGLDSFVAGSIIGAKVTTSSTWVHVTNDVVVKVDVVQDSVASQTAYAHGKQYSAAGVISITLPYAITTGKVQVSVQCFRP